MTGIHSMSLSKFVEFNISHRENGVLCLDASHIIAEAMRSDEDVMDC